MTWALTPSGFPPSWPTSLETHPTARPTTGTFLLFPNPSSAQLSTSGRYWPYDINSLHANYGTADDLKSLSTALHSRDMYLMVDVVVNHMAAPLLPSEDSSALPSSSSPNRKPLLFRRLRVDSSLNGAAAANACCRSAASWPRIQEKEDWSSDGRDGGVEEMSVGVVVVTVGGDFVGMGRGGGEEDLVATGGVGWD